MTFVSLSLQAMVLVGEMHQLQNYSSQYDVVANLEYEAFSHLIENALNLAKQGKQAEAWLLRTPILELLNRLDRDPSWPIAQKRRAEALLADWSRGVAFRQGFEAYKEWFEAIEGLHLDSAAMGVAFSNYYLNIGALDRATTTATEARVQAQCEGDESSDSEALNVLAVVHFMRNEPLLAQTLIEEALQGSSLPPRLLVNLHRKMATVSLMLGRTQDALVHIDKALVVIAHYPDKQLEISTRVRQGVCLAQAGQYEAALAAYNRCLELERDIHRSHWILANIAILQERARRAGQPLPGEQLSLEGALLTSLQNQTQPLFRNIVLVNLLRLYEAENEGEKALTIRSQIEALKAEDLREVGEAIYSPPPFGWDLLPIC